ncbi:MAG: hypothetical protein GY820_39685 [Gammaproteobacteria bacterium]|nr:hypothetical protein [Gammaproteobacteria bacterium]
MMSNTMIQSRALKGPHEKTNRNKITRHNRQRGRCTPCAFDPGFGQMARMPKCFCALPVADSRRRREDASGKAGEAGKESRQSMTRFRDSNEADILGADMGALLDGRKAKRVPRWRLVAEWIGRGVEWLRDWCHIAKKVGIPPRKKTQKNVKKGLTGNQGNAILVP